MRIDDLSRLKGGIILCLILLCGRVKGQSCDNNLVQNPGFEDVLNGWWTWHGGDEAAYAFSIDNTEKRSGDASSRIDVLVNSEALTGNGAEFNSRPAVFSIEAGNTYELNISAKSTLPNTNVRINIKDAVAGWVTLLTFSERIDTSWQSISFSYTATETFANAHLELVVFNPNFTDPYSVFFDDISVCAPGPNTLTCEFNEVDNPGFEAGLEGWWTWHGGDEAAYIFRTDSSNFQGNASGQISVLASSTTLTGNGAEFNNRPDVIPLDSGATYTIRFYAKSSLSQTRITYSLKSEADNWLTLLEREVTIGETWEEIVFQYTSSRSIEDAHLEIKVYNPNFESPYDVWIDEVEICSNRVIEPPSNTCEQNVVQNPGFESGMEDWWTWHSNDESAYTFSIDTDAFRGESSARIDVLTRSDSLTGGGAQYNNRPATTIIIPNNTYIISFWAKSSKPDTQVELYMKDANANWTILFAITDTIGIEWQEVSFIYQATQIFGTAHLEIQILNRDFLEPYSVWIDEVAVCGASCSDFEISLSAFPTSCYNSADGMVVVDVKGGYAPYTYEWLSGESSDTLTELKADNYFVEVTDMVGCWASKAVKVQRPDSLSLIANLQAEHISNDGMIDVTPSGGNPPYSFIWSNGDTTEDISSLQNGTYSLLLSDSLGCSKEWEFNLFPTDLETDKLFQKVSIFPNPAQRQTNLSLDLKTPAEIRIQLFSISGKLVWEKQTDKVQELNTIIDLQSLSPGIYIFNIQANGQRLIKRLSVLF